MASDVDIRADCLKRALKLGYLLAGYVIELPRHLGQRG